MTSSLNKSLPLSTLCNKSLPLGLVNPLKESWSSKLQAKGLEFDTVELCGDFHEPYDENGELISAERLRKPYLQEIPERCWGTHKRCLEGSPLMKVAHNWEMGSFGNGSKWEVADFGDANGPFKFRISGMQPQTGTTATELLLLPLLLFDCFWYGYFWNCYQCYWSCYSSP